MAATKRGVQAFKVSEEEKAANAKLNRSGFMAKYNFEPILVGQRTTVGYSVMTVKFTFKGFKYFFSGREAFTNWKAKVGLLPAKYLNSFPKRRNDTYIVSLTPDFS